MINNSLFDIKVAKIFIYSFYLNMKIISNKVTINNFHLINISKENITKIYSKYC